MATRKRVKLLRLLELLIDGLLLLIFIPKALILGCLLLYGYIPIPADWLNEQLAKAEVSEFQIQAQEYQLYLDGKLQLKDIAIFAQTTKRRSLKPRMPIFTTSSSGKVAPLSTYPNSS